MRGYLQLFTKHGFISTDHPDLLAHLYEAMDNLQVTIVALQRSYPWKPSLVVATGGFNDRTNNIGEAHHTYLLNPRNVRTHSDRDDEDWMNVEIHAGGEYREQLGEFCGVSVSHEWSNELPQEW